MCAMCECVSVHLSSCVWVLVCICVSARVRVCVCARARAYACTVLISANCFILAQEQHLLDAAVQCCLPHGVKRAASSLRLKRQFPLWPSPENHITERAKLINYRNKNNNNNASLTILQPAAYHDTQLQETASLSSKSALSLNTRSR